MVSEPPSLPALLSRADIAKRLGISERTLRRILAGIPGLQCYRFGHRIRFDEADLEIIKAAMREPYPTIRDDATRITYVAPRSARSAQDTVRELTRRLLAQQKKT